MLRRLIGEDVHLEVRLKTESGNVRADPAQLEQVIMNLAVNARDAMPKGGRLEIATDHAELDRPLDSCAGRVEAGRYVVLRIRDGGTGIAPEVREHLFEPFFTTKEKGKGTGLGLPTVATIVRQAGGAIDVETEQGGGSCFSIYLPRVDDLPEAVVVEPRGAVSPRGSETILVVEDETTVRGWRASSSR